MSEQPWNPDLGYSGRLVERHLARRRGNPRPLDATEQYSIAVLRDMLTVVEMAMQDEGAPTEVIRRVLDKVIFGCVPRDVDAMERQTMKDNFVDVLNQRPVPPLGLGGAARG